MPQGDDVPKSAEWGLLWTGGQGSRLLSSEMEGGPAGKTPGSAEQGVVRPEATFHTEALHKDDY